MAHAQVDLPPLELEVRTIEGPSASYRPDTAPEGAWRALEVEQTLSRGDHIRTGDETTVTLRVPGISLFNVTPGTRMQLQRLSRRTEERGLLTTEEVTVNDIEIMTEEGQVQNAVREHEGVATEYDLETPNAVAGVRGTDFQCEVTDFGRTECAVGQGQVRFASRANPEQSVTLQAGQKSSIGPEETTPSEPEAISDTEAQQLEQVAEASQQALALPPTIESLQLNGTSFQDSIRIQYTEPTELTLSGQARSQAEGTSLASVTITVDGTPVSVEGTEEWSLPRTPAVPEEGTERTATIEIMATDTNDNSITRTVTVTLVNPEQQGEAPGEIPPEDYEEGNVPVEVTTVAGRAVDNLEFPYHAYQGDATSQGLMIEGTASGEATLEGVAYSLDGGNEWQLATGSENWQVAIPAQSSGEYTVEVVAWTTAGVIGEPVEIGPIEYEAISYNQAIRRVFDETWSRFGNEDVRGVLNTLSSNFVIEPRKGPNIDRSQFENEMTNDFFPSFDNLRVFYQLNQVFGTPNGGEVSINRLEWRGTYSDEQVSGVPFIALLPGQFTYERLPNGQYKGLSFEDASLNRYAGANEQTVGNLGPNYGLEGAQEAFTNDGLQPGGDQLMGHVLAATDTSWNTTPGPQAPGEFFINTLANFPYCYNCDPPVQAGGIYKLSAGGFSDVQSIPGVTSTQYKTRVGIDQGAVYAVNVAGNGFNDAYLIKVTKTDDTDGDGYYDIVRVQVVQVINPTDGDVRFGGADPLK